MMTESTSPALDIALAYHEAWTANLTSIVPDEQGAGSAAAGVLIEAGHIPYRRRRRTL
jgi:hypothetical protein